MTGLRITIPSALWTNATKTLPGSLAEARKSVFQGAQGFLFDVYDRSSLFQDIGGTVPVTESGQKVALMRDKSGNGWRAVQPEADLMPIYTEDAGRRYLNVSTAAYMTVEHDEGGLVKFTSRTIVFAMAPTVGTNRRSFIQADDTGGSGFLSLHLETSSGRLRAGLAADDESDLRSPEPVPLDQEQVYGLVYNVAGSNFGAVAMRINGVEVAESAGASTGSPESSNGARLFINRNLVYGMAGRFYGMAYAQRASQVEEISKMESYFSRRMGISI